MKKNFIRIVAALLVAMLALTLIPMGAFAYEEQDGVHVQKEYYETKDPNVYDYCFHWIPYGDSTFYEAGSTIKVTDYNKPLIDGDRMYDFAGFVNNETLFESWEENESWQKDTDIPYTKSDISVPKDLTTEAGQEWYNTWKWVYADYVPHSHKLSRWYSDGTTHWRECLVCKNYKSEGFWDQFMYQNWCTDGDEDGICNICGGDVPYHDITIEAPEGYKVTLNRDNASHRMKITADVEAPASAQYKLHFIKVRTDGSEQEIVRYKENGVFYTNMPTYPMKVVIESIQ